MLFEQLGEVARNFARASEAQERLPLAKTFSVDGKVVFQVSNVLPQTLQAGLQSVLGAMRVENSRSLLSLKNPRLGHIRSNQA